jgi:hypothetical protein
MTANSEKPQEANATFPLALSWNANQSTTHHAPSNAPLSRSFHHAPSITRIFSSLVEASFIEKKSLEEERWGGDAFELAPAGSS